MARALGSNVHCPGCAYQSPRLKRYFHELRYSKIIPHLMLMLVNLTVDQQFKTAVIKLPSRATAYRHCFSACGFLQKRNVAAVQFRRRWTGGIFIGITDQIDTETWYRCINATASIEENFSNDRYSNPHTVCTFFFELVNELLKAIFEDKIIYFETIVLR